MDERLEKALEFSKYLETYNNQKQILKTQFLDACVIYFNGGKFTIDRSLIIYAYIGNADVIMDDNNVPIEIEDTKSFYQTIQSQYDNAVVNYHKQLKDLSSKKDVAGLIDS